MKKFADYLKEDLGIDFPKGDVEGKWFEENHINMIVRCTSCGMTMASPSAMIDDNGDVYCASCADVSSYWDDPDGDNRRDGYSEFNWR